VRRLAKFMGKRLPQDHPLLVHLPAFLEHTVTCNETRLRRMGMLDRPLAELGRAKRAALVAEAYGGKALGGLASLVTLPIRLLPWFRRKRLTDTYLRDPHVTGFALPPGGPEAAVAESVATADAAD
jgi:hypothetical protein